MSQHGGVDFISHILSNSCGVAVLIRQDMNFDFRFVKHIVKRNYVHLYIAIKDVVFDITIQPHSIRDGF